MLHEYFEVVYGPLIGPTSLFLVRTLNRHIEAAGGPVTVCPIQLSREVGLRSSRTEPLGKKSHLAKSLDRLAHHRLVHPVGPDTLGVVTAVPPATAKLLARLPDSTRSRHDTFLASLLDTGPSMPEPQHAASPDRVTAEEYGDVGVRVARGGQRDGAKGETTQRRH